MSDAVITPASAAAMTVATDIETAQPICKCGSTERHPADALRCRNGHVLVGNQTSRKHGVRAYETSGRLPEVLRQTVEEFREAVIADRGGDASLSTLEAAYIRRLSEVETVARLLASDLAQRGLTTARGRVRNTVGRWFECLDRWDRLAQRVGVDRRARTLPTLRDYLTQQAASVDHPHDQEQEPER